MPLGSLVIFISSLFIIGFGPIMMLVNNPQFFDPESGSVIGGNNMAAIHLSQAVGGQVFLGFISAVAFATILVVVSGLTLSGASAISHDIYASVIRNGNMQSGEELKVSRVATILLGIAAIFLGIIFEKQNVAYMVGLALAIVTSANFPILFLSVYWQKLTTRGAFVGRCIGSLTAITCMLLGPTIWVDILDHAEPIFPYKHPALFSMMAAFAFILLFSKMDTSASAEAEATAFEDQYVRSQTGLGAEGASQH